jgi:hypothetical protein
MILNGKKVSWSYALCRKVILTQARRLSLFKTALEAGFQKRIGL